MFAPYSEDWVWSRLLCLLSRKLVGICSSIFPGDLALKNGGSFCEFQWSPFPKKQSTNNPQKFRGKFGAIVGAMFGTKIWKIWGTCILQLFWPILGSIPVSSSFHLGSHKPICFNLASHIEAVRKTCRYGIRCITCWQRPRQASVSFFNKEWQISCHDVGTFRRWVCTLGEATASLPISLSFIVSWSDWCDHNPKVP